MEECKNYISEEFGVIVGDRKINVLLKSPQVHDLSEDPILLLSFAMDRDTSLNVKPFCIAADMLLEKGHRVLSFDLPNHGERIDKYGEHISGFRNALADGSNPFDMFLEDASAVIDTCIEQGLASPGRIAVCGTSRAGYLALRLLAADNRITAAAAFAPVTDWRYLSEFSEDVESEAIKNLCLSSFVNQLVGKPVYLVIGNHDDRVSTLSCCRFYVELLEANLGCGYGSDLTDFYCTDDPGHTCGDLWYQLGGEFILKRID